MRVRLVGMEFFITQGRKKRINPVLIAAAMLALNGCSHSDENYVLAPPPPVFDPNDKTYGPVEPPPMVAFTGQPIPFPSNIRMSDSGMRVDEQYMSLSERAAINTQSPDSKCSIKSRFDRKDVVAYEWGENRVGLAVNGVSVGDPAPEGIKLQYRLKLQPFKTAKEKCRYTSHWQGLVGSAYNELYLREGNDTVWKQLDRAIDDVEDAFDKSF